MNYSIYLYEKKRSPSFYGEAVDEYIKRLSSYCRISVSHLKKEKDWERIWRSEAEKILVLPGSDSLSSEAFSAMLADREMKGSGHLSFFIPNPGLQEAWIKETCQMEAQLNRLSLSVFTMAPAMSAMILTEQIYRAYRILHHHPYHK